MKDFICLSLIWHSLVRYKIVVDRCSSYEQMTPVWIVNWIQVSIFSLVAVSGLSKSTETTQKKVQIGMGLLAGSTIMLLTLLWGSCIAVGKCNLVNSTSFDSQDSKWCSLTDMFIFLVTFYPNIHKIWKCWGAGSTQGELLKSNAFTNILMFW